MRRGAVFRAGHSGSPPLPALSSPSRGSSSSTSRPRASSPRSSKTSSASSAASPHAATWRSCWSSSISSSPARSPIALSSWSAAKWYCPARSATWWRAMSVAISRYEVPVAPAAAVALQRGDGAAEIVFARRGAVTALAHLYQRTPCRVLFPHAAPGDIPLAALLTTSGGIAGGDRLRLAAGGARAARAAVAAAAAEKGYGPPGAGARMGIAPTGAPGGWAERLPAGTHPFGAPRVG